MSVATRQAQHVTQLLAREGETVTRASGAMRGIVNFPGPAAGPLIASEVGLAMRMGDQVNPSVSLHEADTVTLYEGDDITVRGVGYIVTRKSSPDSGGMVTVEIMPADGSAPAAGSRYR